MWTTWGRTYLLNAERKGRERRKRERKGEGERKAQ